MSSPFHSEVDTKAATSIFTSILSRLRAVDHFAVGRRILSMIALGKLSSLPIRNLLLSQAFAKSPEGDEFFRTRDLLVKAGMDIEDDVISLRGVFVDVLIPDMLQNKLLDQSAIYAIEILDRLPFDASLRDFGIWFSERLDQIVATGPAGTEVGTPRALTEFMVELAQIGTLHRLYDPCCGLGGLLALAAQKHRDIHVTGADVHPVSAAFARLRLALLEVDVSIFREDSLKATHYDPFDRVLCDPPLGNYIPSGEFLFDRNRSSQLGARKLDSLFLEKSANAISEIGRAVVLVSQATLSRRGPDQDLRAKLVNSGLLEGVIALPAGAVPWTNAELAVVTLDARVRLDHVIFLDGAQTKGSSASRAHVDYSGMMDIYRAGQETERLKVFPRHELGGEVNLLPRRWLRAPEERPDIATMFNEADELFARANGQMARINDLMERLGPGRSQ